MPRGQRTSRGERAPRREPEGPRFEAKEPEQDPGFDDLDDTKFGKKQEKLGRLNLGAGASNIMGMGVDAEDELLDMLDLWSDAGSDPQPGKGKAAASKGGGDQASRRMMGEVGYLSLGAASTVDLVADFRSLKGSEKGKDAAGSSAEVGEAGPSGARVAMPDGVALVGGDAAFEEQSDGSQALLMPECSFLKVQLNASPWVLAEDGRLHSYTVLMALRLESMPTATMPLFNGGAPAPSGEKVENVNLYKNGGVGALNDMGTQEASVRAERWAWVVATRKPGELRTYVDGRLCSVVKLEAAKKKESEASRKGEEEKADDKAGPKPQQAEKFVMDPQFFALFAGDAEGEREGPPRGLAIKYLRVTSKVWEPAAIAEELHKVRSADEEADVLRSAEAARAEQLSLAPLYARPPPIWLHPAFAAEFADPFIAGTPFEDCTMHASVEVLALTLDAMLVEECVTDELSHAARSALNTACSQLKDLRKLAHKLANARKGQGQDRAFFSAVSKAFDELEPGGVLVLPWDGGADVLLVVRRGAVPEEQSCTVTVVNPSEVRRVSEP